MALPVPSTLSPSKLTSFTECALQFRFASVERLPERPTPAATRGTLVHAALEHLFTLPASERRIDAVDACLDAGLAGLADSPDWLDLELDDDGRAALIADARVLTERYFDLEDPTAVNPIGLELKLSVQIDGVTIRGIIDRLDHVDGQLVVTDYKTGRAPSDELARRRMSGVHVYSLLCEKAFGRRPARVQLLHLQEPVKVIAEPSDQSTRGLEQRLGAVWHAIETACEEHDFRPQPSVRCDWCSFKQWCPAWGGDPERAAIDVEIARREAEGQSPLLVL